MVLDPDVVEPADIDTNAVWESLEGEDPGVVACPVCDTDYWNIGHTLRCQCGQLFPTDWRDRYLSGVCIYAAMGQGFTVRSAIHTHRLGNCLYYRSGVEGINWDALPATVSGYDPTYSPDFSPSRMCFRCGNDKEATVTKHEGLCHACESATNCQYRTSILKRKCSAGVKFSELMQPVSDERMKVYPCYFDGHGILPLVTCDKFTPTPVEDILERELCVQKSIDRLMVVLPLVSAIKTEHKGKSWAGNTECPVCNTGTLMMSHSAYNGHVACRCTTEDCINFME
jgi:hypothetical protein